MKWDGEKFGTEIPLGKMIYNNADGAVETYVATAIEIHYPSEHMLTNSNNLTPRPDIEIQIHHKLENTSNDPVTNMKIKVKNSIVSFFLSSVFNIGVNDNFLEGLGITSKQPYI